MTIHPRVRLTSLLLTLAITAGPGCSPGDSDPGAVPELQVTQTSRSRAGMVVTAHPLGTEAGVRMLERGGNAADAAVAAAFALSVVEPSMSGLGGRTQVLLRAADGTLHGIDATTQAPATYDPDTAPEASYGYGVVGVPGTVAGLVKLLEDHGRLPLSVVLEPAIAYAEEGFRLLPGEAERHAGAADQLAEFEGSRAYFLPRDGAPLAAGELFVQADLARTLRIIAEGGADAFYRGEVAEAMVADMEASGGALTREALSAYRAEDVPVVRGSYRDKELVGTWIPSYGAITIQALHILETFQADRLDPVEWAAVTHQAIRAAYRDRGAQDTWEDAERLTSKQWARQRAGDVELPEPASVGPGGTPAVALGSVALEHTTHLSTADSAGMVVALTQSLGPSMGSKVAAPGLGFLYASTLGGYLGRMEPEERARSHISPFLVLEEGEPFLVLGAAGGSRIPSAIIQVVSRVVDGGMELSEALAAPRVYPDGETLQAEATHDSAWSPDQLEALRAMGFPVSAVERTGAFGRVHAIRYHASTGEWEGGADPAWEGSAAGPRTRARAPEEG